ncbi:hypothetical protein GCM10023213_33590 [Prosthecobacter algae]|uniref:DUF4064 domain-containing protein n=1 Tax=Prosthecobacter algae TaxID=1144682 RepID=A0ABP9PBV5_9BACT
METDPEMIPPVSKGRDLARVGAWLQVGLVIGMVMTVGGMVRAFRLVGAAEVADPAKLSAAIGEVLIYIMVGVVMSLVGAVLMLVAVYSSGYRAQWLFWMLLGLGVVYALAFPVGTVVGAVLIITALAKNQELLAEPRKPQVRQRLG